MIDSVGWGFGGGGGGAGLLGGRLLSSGLVSGRFLVGVLARKTTLGMGLGGSNTEGGFGEGSSILLEAVIEGQKVIDSDTSLGSNGFEGIVGTGYGE